MAQSREQIQKALEWAEQNNDQAAVQGLTKLLEEAEAPAPVATGPTPEQAGLRSRDQSLPPHLDQDPIDMPPLMQTTAAPSTDQQIDDGLNRRMNAREQKAAEVAAEKPWGARTEESLNKYRDAMSIEEQRRWDKAKVQYDADQALLQDPANIPSKEEVADWIKMQERARMPSGGLGMGFNPAHLAPIVKGENQQVVRDPDTGGLRWTALPPEDIYADKAPTVGGILAGALASETINAVGRRIEDIEQHELGVQTMQKALFNQLPDVERERVRNELATMYGVDPKKMTDEVITDKVPPHKLKEVFDQNDENESIYEGIRSQEGGVWERFKRAGSALTETAGVGLSHAGQILTPKMLEEYVPGVTEEARESVRDSNVFGAESPESPVFAADTPAAYWLNKWEGKASSERGNVFYDVAIAPFKKFDPDLDVGSTIRYSAERMQEKAYAEEFKRIKKPLLKPGTEFTAEDLFNPETYMSDEAAMSDPLAVAAKMAEQVPNFVPGIIASWGGGRLASRMFTATGNLTGRGLAMSIKEIEKMSRRRGATGGLIGNAVGNSIVYDHVASEVRDTINPVPDEVLMENIKIKSMMAMGLSFEEAKQLAIQEQAASAGRGAWAGSTALSTPTSVTAGLGGGGTLLGKSAGARVASAFALNPLEEGLQELYEGEVSDAAIEEFDPDNPVLKDKGRYTERFFGGAVLSLGTAAPMEALAAAETAPPMGLDKNTQEAAQATQEFIDARNERFAQEMRTSDPTYMEKVSSIRRLEQYEKLQSLQIKEADAIIEMEPTVRQYMKDNIVPDREADLAMLDSLVRFANSQKTDIAVAISKRTTAKQMLEAHEASVKERAEIQKRVNDRLIDLEDIKRLQNNLTSAMEQEPLTLADLDELIDNEYVVTVGDSLRPIITPKGRRALKNLGLVRLNLETALNEGFTGKERRTPESMARRDQIDRMSEDDRENLLYRDAATGVQNERAFKERATDVQAIAKIEVDSLEWVNSNMNYAAGDRLLSRIAGTIEDAVRQIVARGIQEMGGDDLDRLQLYRTSGNEFALTGPNEELIEKILQQAKSDLASDTITDNRTTVTPSITWGKGTSVDAAERQTAKMRTKRVNEGKIADRKKAPLSVAKSNRGLFQKSDRAAWGERAKQVIGLYNQGMTQAEIAKKIWGDDSYRKHNPYVTRVLTEAGLTDKNQLTELQRKVWDGLQEGKTQAQISRELNKGRPEISRVARAARNKVANGAKVSRQKAEEMSPAQLQEQMELQLEDQVQQSLFQLDKELGEKSTSTFDLEMAESEFDALPRDLLELDREIERGDIVEILTPKLAQFGTVTRAWGGASKPRIEVTIGGRRFRFNPEKNWLINHPISSPEDIAWITDNEMMLDPANIPQVIEDVQIGVLGKGDGTWYADFATELVTDQMNVNEYVEAAYNPKYHKLRAATTEERVRAEAVAEDIKKDWGNAPDINLIHDVEQFRADDKVLYDQIMAEVRASGGRSLNSVRGYYDPYHPETGVYVFTPNVSAAAGLDGTNYEQLLQETIFHEVVGHYGVRALFRNEDELNQAMHELVDAFNDGPNSLAKRMEAQLNLYGATTKDFDVARKTLLGEEMVAYTVGLEMSNQIDLTPKQKGIIRKILDWMKAWLNKHFGKYNFVNMTEQRREFWNDDRVRDLVSRSKDFVIRGTPYKKTQYEHGRLPQMRDGDIFQWNVQQILRTATRKLSRGDRNQLKQRYGGIENVPKELPIIPQEGTVKQYISAFNNVTRDNNPYGIKKFELEALALSPDQDWYLFRDLTNQELMSLHAKSQSRKLFEVDRDWYKQYLPGNLVNELNNLFAALDKMTMVGPTQEMMGEHDKFILDYNNYIGLKRYSSIRPVANEQSYQFMAARIREILDQPITQKTKLSWDVIEQHIQSARAYQVYAEGQSGYQALSDERAANLIFNGNPDAGNWLYEDGRSGMSSLSDEEREAIQEAQTLSKERGADIGYNPATGQWMDDPRIYRGSWKEYTPVGAVLSEDYRIHLIKTKGGPYPAMPAYDQHFNPNFAHIRSSVAKFMEAPEGFAANNPSYAGKAWLMIEGQTDWGTKLRTGFSSKQEMQEKDARGRQFYNALGSAYQQGTTRTDRLITSTLTDLATPMMALLPDTDIYDIADEVTPEVQQAQDTLERKAIERYSKPFTELTPEETKETWNLGFIDEHAKFMDSLNKSIDFLTSYLDENKVNLRDYRTLDARMFDALDQYAVNHYVAQIKSGMDVIAKNIVQLGNPAATSSRRIRSGMAALDKIRWKMGDEKAKERLPWVKDKLITVLKGALEPIGASSAQIKDIGDTFSRGVQTTYTLPKDMLESLHRTALIEDQPSRHSGWGSNSAARLEAANPHLQIGREIFEYFVKENWSKNIETVNGPDAGAMAILSDSPLTFSFDTLDPENLAITVTGSPSSLGVFDKYKDDIIEDYIRKIIPKNQERARVTTDSDPALEELYEVFSDNWLRDNDLKGWFEENGDSIEPDVMLQSDDEGNDRLALNNAGVQHREDWENEYRDDAQQYVEENFDWDEFHAEAGLDEDNDQYQALVEENDGDTEAADDWLTDQKAAAEDAHRESSMWQEAIDYEIESIIDSRISNSHESYLFQAQLPIAWDEDGDPTNFVEFKIQADDIGDSFYVYVDDDWKDSYPDQDDAWESAGYHIHKYYMSNSIFPPIGAIMGPDNDAEVEQIEAITKPKTEETSNLQPVVNSARGKFVGKSSEFIELPDAWKQMVEIDKKFKGNTASNIARYVGLQHYPESPLALDKYWRVTMLRYMLADAVRRGFGALVWQEGLATAKRGGDGMGNSDRIRLKRLEWTKEIMTIGGKEIEAFVITGDQLDTPVVVTAHNMEQVMGRKMSTLMKQQASGRWTPPVAENSVGASVKLPFTNSDLDKNRQYLVNEIISEITGRSSYSVHDVIENRFLGFFANEANAQAAIDVDSREDREYYKQRMDRRIAKIQKLGQPQDQKSREVTRERGPLGKPVSSGVIYPEDIGARYLYVIPGLEAQDYGHTYTVPKLAGARMNYEKMLYNAWNKELKKYGVQITTSLIDMTGDKTSRKKQITYEQEGQRGRPKGIQGNPFAEEYGNTEVIAVKDPQTGFVIMTEKMGPLSNRIFNSYDDALKALEHIQEGYEEESVSLEGIEVYTIVFNDEIKNTFSKPIAPFQRDQRLEEPLKEARSKIKGKGKTLVERFKNLRQRAGDTWQHRYVDILHGLAISQKRTGVSDRSYMAGRLAIAGLEARVKSALYYGYPIWDQDTTSFEGKGLLEILSGIGADPDLFGQYLIGLRGKELMLEGYDNLSPEQQTKIAAALKEVEGETIKDKVWAFAEAKAKNEKVSLEGAYALTDADREELGEVGSRFYEEQLWHFRIKGDPILKEDGTPDPRFDSTKGPLTDWARKVSRSGPVIDMRKGKTAEAPVSYHKKKGMKRKVGIHDDPDMTTWERKRRNMMWALTGDPRIVDDEGFRLMPSTGKRVPGRYSKWEKAEVYGVETAEEAYAIIEAVQEKGLEKQKYRDSLEKKFQEEVNLNTIEEAGREHVFTFAQLVALIDLGNAHPQFERVQKEWIEWNGKLLDFAQAAGIINPDTRPFWESEFYAPLFRIVDDRIGGAFATNVGIHPAKAIKRLEGGMPSEPQAKAVHYLTRRAAKERYQEKLEKEVGKKAVQEALKNGYIEVERHQEPYVYKKSNKKGAMSKAKVDELNRLREKNPVLRATDEGRRHLVAMGNNVGDIIDNIMMNTVKIIDAATQNHWKLMAIDDLIETGEIAKSPVAISTAMAPMRDVVNILKGAGLDPQMLPPGFAESLQKVTVLNPLSEKDGYISIFRDGRREYYQTDNKMLYESITLINRKNFHENWAWLTLPKRFYTGSITLSPAFMGANAFRDTISASISGRDDIVPFIDSMKGFVSALRNDPTMRRMTSGGATFEAGYITAGDSRATKHMVEKAIMKAGFQESVIDNPWKAAKVHALVAADAYMKVGSSFENASRVALYKAAKKTGKSELRSLYEALDIMDFAMRGNSSAIQWMAAVLPFFNARIQGTYRTGRGFVERPRATLIKGAIYTFAALAMWAQFRDDERYKQLENWDKATYHHAWIGDKHIRFPRAFEVGAIFTTIPESAFDAMYQKETDTGKQLLRMYLFVLGEAFAFNPTPQGVKPIIEMLTNYNTFTQRDIVSPFDNRLPQDQFGPTTSETMRELAKIMPDVQIGKGNLASPKHLENLYRGYTGTLGKYLMDVSDWLVRLSGDYPLPPARTAAQNWLSGRFYLGSDPPQRTKYETEFYRMIEKVTRVQRSISFYEGTEIDDERLDEILDTEAPWVNVADDLEDIREDVRELNREQMEVDYDFSMTPEEKRKVINDIVKDRNSLYKEAYDLRPGTEANPLDVEVEKKTLLDMITEWGINDSPLAKKRLSEEAVSTMEVLEGIRERMEMRNLKSLAKAGNTNE